MTEISRQQGVFMMIEVGDRRFVVPTTSEDRGKFEFLLHKNSTSSVEHPQIIPQRHGYLDAVRYGLLGGGVEAGQEMTQAMLDEFRQEFAELCARYTPIAPEVVVRFVQLITAHLEHVGEVTDFRVAQSRQDQTGLNVPRAIFDLDQFVARLPETPEVLADVAALEQAGILYDADQLIASGQAEQIRPFARHLLTQVATSPAE